MAYIDNVTNILQIQPDGLPTFVRLSQNENGRNLYFQLAGNEIDIPANATITISGTKPDGTVYSGTGSISDNVILIPEMIQMTAVAGYWDAKVKIISGGNTIATGRIRFVIDADTVDPDSVPSDSELEGLVAEAQQYAETARTEAYGSPLTAQTAAGMTDHTRVYVYTGSETGYTAGHWYFWNGSAWTDGGIYNSTAVNTDPTLTLAGVAADAKATGDAIEAARVAIDDTLTQTGEAADAAAVGSEISGLKEDLNLLAVGEKKYENVEVITGKGVRVATGIVETFSAGITTWAVSELYDIPTGTTKIDSNFENGRVGSQNYGFAIYDEEEAFVIGGHDPSALTIESNYKYIRMTDYKADSDHSGLYVIFEVGNTKELENRLNKIDTATFSDIGKALSPKTVENGTVTEWEFIEPGSGGTSDYNDLENKPQINGVSLAGNKSLADLGIASADSVSEVSDNQSLLINCLEPVSTETGKYASESNGKVNIYNVTGSSVKKYDVSAMIGKTVYFTATRTAPPYNAYVMIADSDNNFLLSFINSNLSSVTNRAITIPDNAKWFYLNYMTSAGEGRVIENLNSEVIEKIVDGVSAKSTGAISSFYAEKDTDVQRVEITNASGAFVESFTCINSGRNLIKQTFTSATTKNGLTFTPNEDGTVTVNGTATANSYITYGSFYAPISSGEEFKLSGCPENGGAYRYRMYAAAGSTGIYDYGKGIEFTTSGGQEFVIVIYIYNGAVCNNLVFKPMVTYDDYNDEYEKPNTTVFVLTIPSVFLDGRTAVIEDGHVYVNGVYITDTTKIIAKEKYSHFWAYSANKAFSVRSLTYEDENHLNNEVLKLNEIPSVYKDFKGKKVVTYGDSLTYYDGNYFSWGDLQGVYCYGYQFYLRKIGMLTTNRGLSGNTTAMFCEKIKQATDLTDYDYMFIMGGDNDDRLDSPIGTLQPIGGTFDTTTVIGALQSAIEYALAANPKLRIILMTQPMGWTYENGALDRVSALIPDAYRQVASQYGLPLIDLYKESGINELTRNTYYIDPPDNTDYMYHPNNDAWKRIGKIIVGKLTAY